jgi:hypothetical protein
MKPKKPEATKSTADSIKSGIQGEFWKIIRSYLENETVEISYAIIKKNYKGKELNESELDALRRNLDFVEWHLNLPEAIINSIQEKEPELPSYDPYPNVDDENDTD